MACYRDSFSMQYYDGPSSRTHNPMITSKTYSLQHVVFCIYKRNVSVAIAKLQGNIVMNLLVVTRCMNISFVVGHERKSSLFFQCILSVL
jgi:hypothetical protein